ncbi:U3 small nucleolar ribonucleoprotein IMP3 [Nematocida sp. AWRm77]|nr:U3 small nucleolar ribonucleoprotein IMP3 [Nematocida sp. AWRm77]
MRELKHHEKKLLRKVDLLEWKGTSTQREQSATRKYCMEERETYTKYNHITGKIRRLALALAKINDSDETKATVVKELTNKLYSLGLIKSRNLLECAKMGATSFCKRRLASVMVDMKMVPDIQTGTTFVKHGHVKVGTQIATDPGLILSRAMEDFVTWRDGSKVKNTIESFRESQS